MNISENKVVQMHYELKNDKGIVLDTSSGKDPLAYIHGKGNIIPGLEKELLNKVKGDKINAVIAPAEAYGVKDDQKIFKVAKKQFQGDGELQIGMQIQAESDVEAVEEQHRKSETPKEFQHQNAGSLDDKPEMPRVGRNEPCPCGSGKKYKQCHGKLS